MKLRRYWFEFAISERESQLYRSYAGLRWGCGITAHNEADALLLLQQHLLRQDPLPQIASMIADVDVSQLDGGHVLPNIGVPSLRGIWFPRI